MKYTPKYFAKLSHDKTWYASRSCTSDGDGKEIQVDTLEACFLEMEEWAKSGIWYCHVKPLSTELQNQLTKEGFEVYEYFGTTGIGWGNAKWGGMVLFEKDKHLLNLESGDLVCGSLNGESLNFYMNNKTHATVGTSMFTVNVVDGVINGSLKPTKIQKKSYWD